MNKLLLIIGNHLTKENIRQTNAILNTLGLDSIDNFQIGHRSSAADWTVRFNPRCQGGASLDWYQTEESPYKHWPVLDLRSVLAYRPSVQVKLNDSYTAQINSDGTVKVGCQTFAKELILELAAALQKN